MKATKPKKPAVKKPAAKKVARKSVAKKLVESVERPLTARQELFCLEYLKDLNSTAAYKRAGYDATGNAAESAASRLLSNVKVAQKIQAGMDKRSEEVGIDAKFVLHGIKRVIDRCEQAEPVLDKDGKETGEYTFQASPALRGYELLGKHLKLFTDVLEVKDTTAISSRMKAARDRAKGRS